MIYVMSGSAPLYAIIAVTYPSGSICTCGGEKAKDTSGYALFPVKAGTYTVECHTSDNSKSKSTSVTIAASDKGKCKSVTLNYELVLFDAGTYAEETGGWGFSGSAGGGSIQDKNLYVYGQSGSDSNDGIGYVYTKSKIDLTNFNTLNFIVSSCSNTSGGRAFGVSSSQSGDRTFTASASISTGTISVDISSLEGSYYIKGYQVGWASLGYFNISKVWLT